MTDRLDTALGNLRKQFGDDIIMRLGDHAPREIDCISSGSISLDLALGGGYARGRVVEIYGPESGGKTTLALHAAANAHAAGLEVAFVDAEHALDTTYAAALGVDVDNLYLSQPDYGEQALQIVIELARSGGAGLIVVDSVAALTPKAELEGQVSDNHVGQLPRMMGQGLRMLVGAANQTGTTIIFINQIREKIGVIYGSPETQPGGRALKFFATQRIDIRRKSTEGNAGEQTHNRVKVKVVKNKIAPPFRETELDLVYGEGISGVGDLLDMAAKLDLISVNGSWYTLDDARVQGREAAKQALSIDADLHDRLRSEIMELHAR